MDTQIKKSFLIRFWWVGVIVVLIFCVGVFFFVKNNSETISNISQNINQKSQESLKKNINTFLDNEEKIDTTDWLTYRNETAKFELKYPPTNWEVEAIVGEDPSTTLTPTFRYCGYQEESSFLSFYAYDYQVEDNARLEDQFFVLDLDRILEQQFINLGDERAMQTKFVRQKRTVPEEFIDVIHHGRAYRLLLGPEPEEECQNDFTRTVTYRALQDKILSTFKFID